MRVVGGKSPGSDVNLNWCGALYKGLHGDWNMVDLQREIFWNMNILNARLIKVTHVLATVVIFGDLRRFGPSLAFYGRNNSDSKGRWQRRPKTVEFTRNDNIRAHKIWVKKTLKRSNEIGLRGRGRFRGVGEQGPRFSEFSRAKNGARTKKKNRNWGLSPHFLSEQNTENTGCLSLLPNPRKRLLRIKI